MELGLSCCRRFVAELKQPEDVTGNDQYKKIRKKGFEQAAQTQAMQKATFFWLSVECLIAEHVVFDTVRKFQFTKAGLEMRSMTASIVNIVTNASASSVWNLLL